MKDRITLTIDPGTARRAKKIAHERNTSVSALVEELLDSAYLTADMDTPSFVEKWAGKFKVRKRSKTDPRLEELKRRYHLDRE
jgi:hypothetical protein